MWLLMVLQCIYIYVYLYILYMCHNHVILLLKIHYLYMILQRHFGLKTGDSTSDTKPSWLCRFGRTCHIQSWFKLEIVLVYWMYAWYVYNHLYVLLDIVWSLFEYKLQTYFLAIQCPGHALLSPRSCHNALKLGRAKPCLLWVMSIYLQSHVKFSQWF